MASNIYAEDTAMRLFIAIQLSDDIRNSLSAVQAYLRDHGVRGNYTKIENLHLTLAFIGEYSDPDSVLEVMRSVPFTPFPMRIEGFGSFGDLYWCGNRRERQPALLCETAAQGAGRKRHPLRPQEVFTPHHADPKGGV